MGKCASPGLPKTERRWGRTCEPTGRGMTCFHEKETWDGSGWKRKTTKRRSIFVETLQNILDCFGARIAAECLGCWSLGGKEYESALPLALRAFTNHPDSSLSLKVLKPRTRGKEFKATIFDGLRWRRLGPSAAFIVSPFVGETETIPPGLHRLDAVHLSSRGASRLL